jgi:hypothetical protein
MLLTIDRKRIDQSKLQEVLHACVSYFLVTGLGIPPVGYRQRLSVVARQYNRRFLVT